MNRFNQRTGIGPGLWLLILLLATFAIYLSGLHIWYYGDDFQYLFADPPSRIFHFFFNRNLYHGFYRPVNSSIIAVVQMLVGWETWPIHVINTVVHALLAWLVYLLMRREAFTQPQALLGSAFMVFSQENAGAVLSVDTFSQISGTFFGCLALWTLYVGFFRRADHQRQPNEPFPLTYYILAVLSFILSLLSKETSVSFLPMVGIFFLAKNWRLRKAKDIIVRTTIEVLPFFILTLLYMAVRSAIGLSQPTGGSGTYGFSFGFNILRNLAQFLLAAILPASSASTFVAIKTGEKVLLAAILLGALIFLALVLYGLWRTGRRRSFLPMLLFTLVGLFPAMLMNHVGELYLYNSMPFIAVLVGAALGTLFERSRSSSAARGAFIGFMIALVASHVVAIQMKAASMRENGSRARRLLGELMPHVQQMPADGHLFLLTPPGGPPEYSVFLMNGFSVFKWGVHAIPQEAKRPDVTVEVIESPTIPDSIDQSKARIVTLENDSVVPYK